MGWERETGRKKNSAARTNLTLPRTYTNTEQPPKSQKAAAQTTRVAADDAIIFPQKLRLLAFGNFTPFLPFPCPWQSSQQYRLTP